MEETLIQFRSSYSYNLACWTVVHTKQKKIELEKLQTLNGPTPNYIFSWKKVLLMRLDEKWSIKDVQIQSLTYSFSMHSFSTRWKRQKTVGFSDIFRDERKSAVVTNGLSCYTPNDKVELLFHGVVMMSLPNFKLEKKKCHYQEWFFT